ncbi:pfkB family carbohydrate kinase [Georgenia satyanarayanai]|uniref:PfkB family carbohydrate kinase n=1 Tax=Georgenia satyanarayanai TaxID=860221 RepID=A0A2Y9A4C2_9MICO|nr:PfkB family carbohydrate kinase [Georgenia satyanarayanai]PYG02220.1 pfkB family carbohydrate kinase [Georgenia satyanarayanai]SSA37057.1 pfkB family carbohydrate kinase [Georgenia satyanarayanai]
MGDAEMTIDTDEQERSAPTSVPSRKAPDQQSPLRRSSDDPTLGDGRKPPTTFAWAPTPTLTDRRVLESPAFVVVDDVASREAAGARVAEGLERLGRPVERMTADGTRPRSTRPSGPLHHPLVVHVGSASALHGPAGDTVARTVSTYRPGATIVFTPGLQGEPSAGAEELRSRVEAMVATADVVIATTGDLELLYPGEARENVLRRWVGSGPGIVIVSAAGEGAWAANAVGVTATVSGRGAADAGDAFVAGVIDALWKAGLLGVANRADLRTLVWGTLHELVENAAVAASVAARSDGLAPTREELDAARGIPRLGR